jgi:hypothetical protein
MDTGTWNAKMIYPAGSGFVNSPDNIGRYNIVHGTVHATAAFATDGPGRPVKTDFARAILTLPIPASNKCPLKGVVLHVADVQDGGKSTITVGRFTYQSSTIAQISADSVQIFTNDDLVPSIRPCYQVWIKLTYTADECYDYSYVNDCYC